MTRRIGSERPYRVHPVPSGEYLRMSTTGPVRMSSRCFEHWTSAKKYAESLAIAQDSITLKNPDRVDVVSPPGGNFHRVAYYEIGRGWVDADFTRSY